MQAQYSLWIISSKRKKKKKKERKGSASQEIIDNQAKGLLGKNCKCQFKKCHARADSGRLISYKVFWAQKQPSSKAAEFFHHDMCNENKCPRHAVLPQI